MTRERTGSSHDGQRKRPTNRTGRAEDDEDDEEETPSEETKKGEGEESRMAEKFLRARTILVSEPISSDLAKRI